MSFRKILPVVAMMSIFFGLIGSASADGHHCLGLGEEDCALYTELSHISLPSSTAFELNTDISVAGTDPEMSEPLELSIGANGAYVIDETVAEAAFEEFGALTILDVNLGSILDVTSGVVGSFNAELTLDISGLSDLLPLPINTVDLWLVDGVAYVDLSPIAFLLGPDAAGVFGVDVFDTITSLLGSMTIDQIFSMADMGMGDMDMDDMDMDDMMDDMDMGDMDGNNPMDAFMGGFQQGMEATNITDADLANFVSMERVEDEDGLAVFVTTVNMAGVFDVEAIRQLTLTQLANQDMGDLDAKDLLDAIAEGLGDSSVVITERFDVETGYLVSSDFVLDLTFDTSAFAQIDAMEMGLEGTGDDGESLDKEDDADDMEATEEAMDDMGDMEPMAPPVIEIDVTSSFARSDINEVESIDLPEDAQVVPLGAMLGGDMGEMDDMGDMGDMEEDMDDMGDMDATEEAMDDMEATEEAGE